MNQLKAQYQQSMLHNSLGRVGWIPSILFEFLKI